MKFRSLAGESNNCIKKQELGVGDKYITKNPKETAKLMLGEFSHRLNFSSTTISDLKFTAQDFAQLINLELSKTINKAEQKEILKIMFDTGNHPENILKTVKRNISDDEIKEKILSLASQNPKLVSDFKNGGTKCIDFFLGQIIRTFGKSVNIADCKKLIGDILGSI